MLDPIPNYHYSTSAMKDAILLTVTGRDEKLTAKNLRKTGSVPAVIYGNADHASVQCSAKDLHSVYVKAGENTLVDVNFNDKKIPCLIHAISFNPVNGNYDHVDFYAVNMTKEVTTNVPVVFEGECPAVKNFGGILLTVHSELEVSCLPNAIPSQFTVDLSKLENLHDTVTVASIEVPPNVTISEAPETVILIVQEPRKEEVIEPVVTAAAEGVPADGAAAPAGTAPAAGAPAADAKAAPAKK